MPDTIFTARANPACPRGVAGSATAAKFAGAVVIALLAATFLSACAPGVTAPVVAVRQPPSMSAVDMNNPLNPRTVDGPVVLNAAKNESTSFVLQIANLPAGNVNPGNGSAAGSAGAASSPLQIRLGPLQSASGGAIDASRFAAFQVLPMPVDANRAGYVRQTGQAVAQRQMPRALLPVKIDGAGLVDTRALRDPAKPTDATASASDSTASTSPALLWIDLKVPVDAKPGEYWASCDLISQSAAEPVASVPVKLTVYDFALPDDRHLAMVGRLGWSDLRRLYPDELEAITPAWLNRTDPRYAPAVRLIDQLQQLAEDNRAQIIVPRLQPVVKWPAGQLPKVEWDDFDSVLAPWLNGSAFADKVAINYWPIPSVDGLANFDVNSQLDYWSEAARHYAKMGWTARSAIAIDPPARADDGPPAQAGLTAASELARKILDATPAVRVMLSLREDQLQLAAPDAPNGIDPDSIGRVDCAAPGLVFAAPANDWPASLKHPHHWLGADEPGLLPYVGAGADERDVRLWAWLAYLRRAALIQWGSTLPETSSPGEAADPSQLTWFYPGSWFGVDEPVPTIQLKWLRRAQQDFEYLYLAEQRGMRINALLLARLITKPVQIQPNQPPDPVYALMSGTTDQQAWDQATDLLARTILLRAPGAPVDPSQERLIDLETLRWEKPKERPFLLPRTVRWMADNSDPAEPGNWVDMNLGIDIYNASDTTPDEDSLHWSPPPDDSGWQVAPQDVPIPPLQTFRVQRFDLGARFNLDKITPSARQPMQVTFVDGNTRAQTRENVMLPVAGSDRVMRQLTIDGRLGDWSMADAIQDGPMVRLIDRPALQNQQMQTAGVPAQVFTGWADEDFYVAFKLTGISPNPGFGRNFVETQFRRAWGEDLCQILIQPIYADNTLGPVLHCACKPNGVVWVERKSQDRDQPPAWLPLEGSGIRYAATVDGDYWRGEVAIPWSAILDAAHAAPSEADASASDAPPDPMHARPKLLRFNFVQHQTSTGETASWAGPIDFGRDDTFMGLLYLREP